MSALKRVLIIAGGTGGHVFPGLALAAYLQEKGIEVHWLGTAQGFESRVVPQANIPLHLVNIRGLRGKGLLALALAPLRIAFALLQSLKILWQIKPDVVIGMGGFVSGPAGVASWLLRYPLIIHEQNAKAGLTNQWLKYLAKKVLTGFPDVFPYLTNASVVGNPVRTEIAMLPPPSERFQGRNKPLRLLIIGGSLGAKAINDIVPRCLAKLSADQRPEVYHQIGDKNVDSASASYREANVQATVVPFITDMAAAYAWADIVLCRAGALTVAELCAVGLGSILVPYPYAVDDHQTANAKFLVENGAAILIQQRDLTEDKLMAILKELNVSPEKRLVMAHAAYQLRKIDVAEKMVNVCYAL